RVGRDGERRVPGQCRRRAAGDRPATRHGPGAGLAWKELLEEAAVPVGLPGQRSVDREALGRGGELGIAHQLLRMRLQAVDPAVADAIAELFLLAPEDGVRQHAGEGLPQY